MKRLFGIIIFLLSLFAMYAQSNQPLLETSQDGFKTLVCKVDSLEHELSYLKLKYDLNTLNSDLSISANEVYSKSLGIELNVYKRNCDSGLLKAYKSYYESCQSKMEAFSDLIENNKRFFYLKVVTGYYSDSELKSLRASYDVIDAAYENLERSVEMLKLMIEAYSLCVAN